MVATMNLLWKGVKKQRAKNIMRKQKALFLILCILASVVPIVYLNYLTITYFLRPLWDTPLSPFSSAVSKSTSKINEILMIIPHYYAEGIPMSQLCTLHGWRQRETPRRVFDAVIFSNEIDLLEIRMRELMPVVTKFVVVESNATFTGQPKPLLFEKHKQRFNFASSKLVHFFLPSRPHIPDEDPFVNEHYQRDAMENALALAGIEDGDLLITADTDEVPSVHTVHLLQNCDGYPTQMHLQLRNYIYSFEFLLDSNSWRSNVQIVNRNSTYRHARTSDSLLADAGWHCSFCFRYIADFIFKMQAYSHADRVHYASFLDPRRIQGIICKGGDLFDMLPEEYTFKELIGKLGLIPRSYSGVHLPAYLLENAELYRYLLPGNCTREPDPDPLPVDEPFI